MQDIPDWIVESAMGVAQAKFVTRVRVPYGHLLSVEDEEQDWKLYVLAHLHSYDPEKGSLLAWMEPVFLTWWTRSAKRRLERQRHEIGFDSTPGAFEGVDGPDAVLTIAQQADRERAVAARQADQELSPRARELLEVLPQKVRQTALHHYGMGTAQRDVADLVGVTFRTVVRHLSEARNVWSEHFGVEIRAKETGQHTDTHCSNGHRWDDDNLRFSKRSDGTTFKRCKTCGVNRRREYERRRMEDAA